MSSLFYFTVFVKSFVKNQESLIFTENGIIETASVIILVLCLLRSGQYALQSHIKQGHYFWLASVLTFFTVIRRELNHLPDLFVPKNFLFLSHSYDWWEDAVLLLIYLLTVGFLFFAWRYCWSLLKRIPVSLYLCVAGLALIQYMGENAIVFSHDFGLIVEELAEVAIYSIALAYLWSFKLNDFYIESEKSLELNKTTNS